MNKTVFLLVDWKGQGSWFFMDNGDCSCIEAGKGGVVEFRKAMDRIHQCQAIALGWMPQYREFIEKALHNSYLTVQPTYDANSMLFALGIEPAKTDLLKDNGSSLDYHEGTVHELAKLLLPVLKKKEKPATDDDPNWPYIGNG